MKLHTCQTSREVTFGFLRLVLKIQDVTLIEVARVHIHTYTHKSRAWVTSVVKGSKYTQ